MRHDACATLVALKSKLDDHRPLAPDLLRNLRKVMVLSYTYHRRLLIRNLSTGS